MSVDSIAFLCHPYHRGGVTSWMISAAQEAARQGLHVYFITVDPIKPFISGGNRPAMTAMFTAVPENFHLLAPKVGYEFELGINDYRSYVYSKTIKDNVPLNTPIIVSDDVSVWEAAARIASDYPLIGVLHSDDPHYYALANKYQNYVSKFVAVSNRIAGKTNITQNHTINIIPCGINIDDYKSKINTTEPTDILRISWVGRLEEAQKRVSDIPLIAHELSKTGIKYEFRVAGTGPEQNWLAEKIKEGNLNIKLLGWKSGKEIVDILFSSDLLLQTSNFEGMSVAVMEALASGCGIVSTKVSGVEDYEYSQYAQNCLKLYEIGNIGQAVQQILSLSRINREDKTKAAKHFANAVFSIESCVNQYIQIVKSAKPTNTSLKLQISPLWLILKSCTLAFIRKTKYEVTTKLISRNH